MQRRTLPSLDRDPRAIQPCEPRLALSASLAGDLLLEAFDLSRFQPAAVEPSIPMPSPELQSFAPRPVSSDPLDSGEIPNLLDQAAELRGLRGLDGRGQTVAVIDSGIAWDHVALGAGYGPGYRVVGGWDFAENDADPYDDGPAGYHGTHVSGLLAGSTDRLGGSQGFAGVAPGADIVGLRVFDDSGAGQLQWIESALQWVHQNKDAFASPITTVNLSIGAALTDANRDQAMAMLEDEFALLRQDNILVFAAAGNFFDGDRTAGVLYPASSASVVAVGSVDSSGDLSGFAQREPGLLATRGEAVSSAVPDHVFGWDGKIDDMAALDGTSMATPQVAAASMLVRQAMIDEGLQPTADEILSRLRQASVERIDPVTGINYHTIDLAAAVGWGGTSSDPSSTDSSTSGPPTITRFFGSNEGEQIELDLRNGIELRVGDRVYRLDPNSADQPLVIDVGGGNDSLVIHGSEAAERLILSPPLHATSSLSTNSFQIELRGFENVVFHGGGGPDRATLFDSTGSDTLESHPHRATLSGVGFQFDVQQVPRIYVHGTAGGNDTAFLHDGAGNDSLEVRPQFTSLRSDDAFQLAYGFERVYAYSNAGGVDSAAMYDSAGDDTMSISNGRSIITGPGYHVSASGFASTIGHATAGGFDIARVYADHSNNQWSRTEDMIQWTGNSGAVRVARGFERAEAFEQFEPIELIPLSTRAFPAVSSPQSWDSGGAKLRVAREADAARAIFAALGNQ